MLFFFATVADAQNKIVVRSNNTKVYEKPETGSEVLYTLKKGNPVHVLGINKNGWARVRINIDGSFGFTGWVFQSSLGVSQSLAKTDSPSPTQSGGDRVSDLDKFFQPTDSGQQLTPRTKKEPKAKRERKAKPSQDQDSYLAAMEPAWTTEILSIIAKPSYALHTYRLSQLQGEVFKYSLSGPSLWLGIRAQSTPLFQERFFPSVDVGASYTMLNVTTNLRDSSGNQFGDIKAGNRVLGFDAKANLLVDVHQTPHGRVLVGPTIGYTYASFKGDDIVDDNGIRSGLYVSNRTASLTLGLHSEITVYPPFKLVAGLDVGINNKFEESPEDYTGAQASPNKLWAPYIALHFPIKRPHQFLGLEYRMRYQKTSFTGPSQPRAGDTVTDAFIEQIYHFAGLTYTFKF